jgi:esterase/lipase superfamily enzyme
MGELESPSVWKLEFKADPAKHVVLEQVVDEDRDNFFKQVSSRALNSMRREAFVFVHGFDNTFEDAARRTAQMAYDLAFDGAPILYSWPSQGKMDLINYNRDGRNAELSSTSLKSFLEQLATRTRATTIHVIAHSMGNRVLAASLREIAKANKPRFQQIALMAPDIDAMVFRNMAQAIHQTADRVTLYASSRDQALLASARFNGYRRAGEGGDNILVVPGIDTVDASAVDTSLLGALHQYYADNQAILGDLFHLLRGESPKSRFRLRNVHSAMGDYWLFEPAAR